MKTNKKLTLKSEKLASLSKSEMGNVLGGKEGGSTHHKFLCGLCTNTTVDTGDIIDGITKITPLLTK